MRQFKESTKARWEDLLPGGIWNSYAERMSEDLATIAHKSKLSLVKIKGLKDPEVVKWVAEFPGVRPHDDRKLRVIGSLYDPAGGIHFDVYGSVIPNKYVFVGEEFNQEMTTEEFMSYVEHARSVKSLGKPIKESRWTRFASTDEQEEAITALERALKKKRLAISGGTTIGRSPQGVVLDVKYQDNAFYISPLPNENTEEVNIDVSGTIFPASEVDKAVEHYISLQKQQSESVVTESGNKPEDWYLFVVDHDERGEFKAHVEDYQGNTVFEFDYPNNEYDEDGEIVVWDSFFEDGWVRSTSDSDGWKDYLVNQGILNPSDNLTTDEDEFQERVDSALELTDSKGANMKDAENKFNESVDEFEESEQKAKNESFIQRRPAQRIQESRMSTSSDTQVVVFEAEDGLVAKAFSEGGLNDVDPATLRVYNENGVVLKEYKFGFDGKAKTTINEMCKEHGFSRVK